MAQMVQNDAVVEAMSRLFLAQDALSNLLVFNLTSCLFKSESLVKI